MFETAGGYKTVSQKSVRNAAASCRRDPTDYQCPQTDTAPSGPPLSVSRTPRAPAHPMHALSLPRQPGRMGGSCLSSANFFPVPFLRTALPVQPDLCRRPPSRALQAHACTAEESSGSPAAPSRYLAVTPAHALHLSPASIVPCAGTLSMPRVHGTFYEADVQLHPVATPAKT